MRASGGGGGGTAPSWAALDASKPASNAHDSQGHRTTSQYAHAPHHRAQGDDEHSADPRALPASGRTQQQAHHVDSVGDACTVSTTCALIIAIAIAKEAQLSGKGLTTQRLGLGYAPRSVNCPPGGREKGVQGT